MKKLIEYSYKYKKTTKNSSKIGIYNIVIKITYSDALKNQSKVRKK